MTANKDFDILQEIANKISVRSANNTPISTEEVIEIFKEVSVQMAEVRIIEMPVFLPIIIEKEDEMFIARSHAYQGCNGLGNTEDEAIQNVIEKINRYNKSYIETEKKMRIEELIKNILPNDFY